MFDLSIQKVLLKDILQKLIFHFFLNTWRLRAVAGIGWSVKFMQTDCYY